MMSLRDVWLDSSPIKDLSPLCGKPLAILTCANSPVAGLTPLRDAPLKNLKCNFDLLARHAEMLRKIPTLERINDQPAAEVWKEVDARKR